MIVREWKNEEIALVMQWFVQWGFHPLPESSLPRLRLMVEYDGAPLCACCVYETDSDLAWIEWVVSDKNKSGIIRRIGVRALVAEAKKAAAERGFRVGVGLTPNTALQRVYEEEGFVVGDRAMTSFFCDLRRVG